jgi:hypothetical protein
VHYTQIVLVSCRAVLMHHHPQVTVLCRMSSCEFRAVVVRIEPRLLINCIAFENSYRVFFQ